MCRLEGNGVVEKMVEMEKGCGEVTTAELSFKKNLITCSPYLLHQEVLKETFSRLATLLADKPDVWSHRGRAGAIR